MQARFNGHNPIMNNTVGETAIDGRVIPVGRGGEAIVFEIPMGFWKLVCIANIPEEGQETAPVYLKLKVGDYAFRRAQFDSVRRSAKMAQRQAEGHVDDGEEDGEVAEGFDEQETA